MVEYATDPDQVERSKCLFVSNGSNTGAGMACACGALIVASALVNARMTTANTTLSDMFCLC